MSRSALVTWILVVTAGATCSAASAYGGTSSVRESGSRTTIVVIAGKPTEYSLQLSRTSVKRGTVTFQIKNRGKLAHGFVINGQSSIIVRPRKSATLTVTFKRRGKYTYQCAQTYSTDDDMPDAGPVDVTQPAQCGGGVLKVT